MYTHSYSFDPDIRLHLHSAECTVRLLNKLCRNNYLYNPKFVGNTGNQTRDLWLGKCIQTSGRVLHAFWLKGGHFEVKEGHPDFLQITWFS